MAEPFLSEIRIMSFVFPPKGWALCNGQFLPINQNQALFALLGTTFGGNGQTTFALPDMRGKTPIHVGNGHTLGQTGGASAHTLSTSQLPTHTHVMNGSSVAGNQVVATANVLGTATATDPIYAAPTKLVALEADSITNVGGSQAHLNMQPYLTVSYCIALQGIFPSQN